MLASLSLVPITLVMTAEEVHRGLYPRHAEVRRERVAVSHHVVESDLLGTCVEMGRLHDSMIATTAAITHIHVVLEIKPLVVGENVTEP
jgi:hypothetical protein